ncbi:MAG: hypothetical protein GY724_03255 [Actinomycetia bacterium]|nr:hypothetical protein [Actinomycetes bacterium]MCP4227460.1 hypothetical protein [Actinomycetes bacterium]MCP5034708.1 hypothetical protein [Actinomycetes bacterium]
MVLWASPDGRIWRQSAEHRVSDQLTINPSINWGPAGFLVTFTTVTADLDAEPAAEPPLQIWQLEVI